MVFSKRKKSSPEFDNYFFQLIIITTLKFLTFFVSLPENSAFAEIFSCHLLEKLEFCPNLGNSPPGTAMITFNQCPKFEITFFETKKGILDIDKNDDIFFRDCCSAARRQNQFVNAALELKRLPTLAPDH